MPAPTTGIVPDESSGIAGQNGNTGVTTPISPSSATKARPSFANATLVSAVGPVFCSVSVGVCRVGNSTGSMTKADG